MLLSNKIEDLNYLIQLSIKMLTITYTFIQFFDLALLTEDQLYSYLVFCCVQLVTTVLCQLSGFQFISNLIIINSIFIKHVLFKLEVRAFVVTDVLYFLVIASVSCYEQSSMKHLKFVKIQQNLPLIILFVLYYNSAFYFIFLITTINFFLYFRHIQIYKAQEKYLLDDEFQYLKIQKQFKYLVNNSLPPGILNEFKQNITPSPQSQLTTVSCIRIWPDQESSQMFAAKILQFYHILDLIAQLLGVQKIRNDFQTYIVCDGFFDVFYPLSNVSKRTQSQQFKYVCNFTMISKQVADLLQLRMTAIVSCGQCTLQVYQKQQIWLELFGEAMLRSQEFSFAPVGVYVDISQYNNILNQNNEYEDPSSVFYRFDREYRFKLVRLITLEVRPQLFYYINKLFTNYCKTYIGSRNIRLDKSSERLYNVLQDIDEKIIKLNRDSQISFDDIQDLILDAQDFTLVFDNTTGQASSDVAILDVLPSHSNQSHYVPTLNTLQELLHEALVENDSNIINKQQNDQNSHSESTSGGIFNFNKEKSDKFSLNCVVSSSSDVVINIDYQQSVNKNIFSAKTELIGEDSDSHGNQFPALLDGNLSTQLNNYQLTNLSDINEDSKLSYRKYVSSSINLTSSVEFQLNEQKSSQNSQRSTLSCKDQLKVQNLQSIQMNNLAHIDAENSDVSENVNRLLHEASSKDASILFQQSDDSYDDSTISNNSDSYQPRWKRYINNFNKLLTMSEYVLKKFTHDKEFRNSMFSCNALQHTFQQSFLLISVFVQYSISVKTFTVIDVFGFVMPYISLQIMCDIIGTLVFVVQLLSAKLLINKSQKQQILLQQRLKNDVGYLFCSHEKSKNDLIDINTFFQLQVWSQVVYMLTLYIKYSANLIAIKQYSVNDLTSVGPLIFIQILQFVRIHFEHMFSLSPQSNIFFVASKTFANCFQLQILFLVVNLQYSIIFSIAIVVDYFFVCIAEAGQNLFFFFNIQNNAQILKKYENFSQELSSLVFPFQMQSIIKQSPSTISLSDAGFLLNNLCLQDISQINQDLVEEQFTKCETKLLQTMNQIVEKTLTTNDLPVLCESDHLQFNLLVLSYANFELPKYQQARKLFQFQNVTFCTVELDSFPQIDIFSDVSSSYIIQITQNRLTFCVLPESQQFGYYNAALTAISLALKLIRKRKQKAGLAHGELSCMTLGDYQYQFSAFGPAFDDSELSLRNAEPGSVCLSREVFEQFQLQRSRFQIELQAIGEVGEEIDVRSGGQQSEWVGIFGFK